MGRYRDLTGQKFGMLTCIKDVGRSKSKSVMWLCRCDCGNETIVNSGHIVSGNTKSCGCLIKEVLTKRNTTHSLTKDSSGRQTKLYNVWVSMRQRCFNAKSRDYKDYGGRGITVCKSWLDYKNFHNWAMTNGYKDGLTIERINVNGDYEPNNCIWVTPDKQAKNTRNNHFISYNGQTKILAEWSRILGVESSLLRYRLKTWSVEEAFTTPVKQLRNNTRRVNKIAH
jgi:hypothetical protein